MNTLYVVKRQEVKCMARLKACGGMEVYLHVFLVLSLDGGEWSCSRLVTYTTLVGDKWWAA